MELDRSLGDGEPRRDRLVAEALGEQAQHFELARRERRELGRGTLPRRCRRWPGPGHLRVRALRQIRAAHDDETRSGRNHGGLELRRIRVAGQDGAYTGVQRLARPDRVRLVHDRYYRRPTALRGEREKRSPGAFIAA